MIGTALFLLLRVASIACGLAALAALNGCASDDAGGAQARDSSPAVKLPARIVTDEAIRHQERGSPERTLLAWWQAAQFSDVAAIERLTDPRAIERFGRARLGRLIQKAGPALGGLRIVNRSRSGPEASVRATILTYEADRRTPSSVLPTSFSLVRHGGRWLFASGRYLNALARAYPGV